MAMPREKRRTVKGTAVTREFIITLAVLIMAVMGIIMVYRMMTPSLENSLEGRAEWTAHELSVYMSGLSMAEEGRIDKNLDGKFDIEIQYRGGNNYRIRVTSYDREKESSLLGEGEPGGAGATRGIESLTGNILGIGGDDNSEDSRWIPFVAKLGIPNREQDKLVLRDVEFVSLSKSPGQPVSISAANDIVFCEEPTKEEIKEVLETETREMGGIHNPIALVKALWSQESRFLHCDGDDVKESETGNIGIGMIGEGVANEYDSTLYEMRDPVLNMQVSVMKLTRDSRLFSGYGDSEQLLVAYYNCGTAILNLAREHCTNGGDECWSLMKDKLGPEHGACTRMASDGRPETVVHVEKVMEYYELFRKNEYRECYSHPMECKEGYV